MSAQDRLWAIILAGGDGRRVAPLTDCLYGKRLPKQFAVLAGDRSLLQATIDRMLPLVPPRRVVVVVSLAYAALAREQLAKRYGAAGEVHLVAQPANRGTGPGILLPLAHVLAMDPRARVVVTPSDHHYRDAEPLMSAIAAAACQTATVSLTLVGAEAERAETEYGWIETGAIMKGHVRRIEGFVEKPSAPRARELFRRGDLWNTFVMVSAGTQLWRMAEERMPAQAALIRACTGKGSAKGPCLGAAYDQIEAASFSRAVLEIASDLGVVCARRCGFSDWGSPERIFDSLRGTPDMDRLLARLSPDLGGHRRASSSVVEVARSGSRSQPNEGSVVHKEGSQS